MAVNVTSKAEIYELSVITIVIEILSEINSWSIGYLRMFEIMNTLLFNFVVERF